MRKGRLAGRSSEQVFDEGGVIQVYERFTDRTRRVLQFANQEAKEFGHEHIGPEHILLGLVKEGSGVAAHVLKEFGVDLRRIRIEVERQLGFRPDVVLTGKLPQTQRSKKAIEFAIEEARNLGHNYVGTEHVLLGLLREQDGVAARVLLSLGLDLETVRAGVISLVCPKPEDPPGPAKMVEQPGLPPEPGLYWAFLKGSHQRYIACVTGITPYLRIQIFDVDMMMKKTDCQPECFRFVGTD